MLRALQRPEFNVRGVRRADLHALLPDLKPPALSPQRKRVTGTYRYYLTRLGRAGIAAACSITELRIVPALAAARLRILCHFWQP